MYSIYVYIESSVSTWCKASSLFLAPDKCDASAFITEPPRPIVNRTTYAYIYAYIHTYIHTYRTQIYMYITKLKPAPRFMECFRYMIPEKEKSTYFTYIHKYTYDADVAVRLHKHIFINSTLYIDISATFAYIHTVHTYTHIHTYLHK